jgi:hypothetical protein
MSKQSYLLGEMELQLDEIKKLNQYFENILTYNADRKLVPKKGEDGKELKKLKLNFSIFQEGRYGKNVSFTIPQTKEQRENKEPKKYVANGKIYYASDDLQGFVQKSDNASLQKEEVVVSDDLPF